MVSRLDIAFWGGVIYWKRELKTGFPYEPVEAIVKYLNNTSWEEAQEFLHDVAEKTREAHKPRARFGKD